MRQARIIPLCVFLSFALAYTAEAAGDSGALAVTEEPEDDGLAPYPLSALEGPEAERITAPVVASLVLTGDITVEFVEVDDDAIGIGTGGPIASETGIDAVQEERALSASPAAFYLALAPRGTQVPPALQELSDRVVAAGHWNPTPPTLGGEGSRGQTSAQVTSCGDIEAGGEGNLHANWGNCTVYSRDVEGTTEWTMTDIVAYAGNVKGVAGTVLWDVQKRNCLTIGCKWYFIHTKVVPQGYTYYYSNSNTNNDFKAFSRVTALGNGTQHIHDVGRCHDWKGRVNALHSTLAGGCGIYYKHTNELFCSKVSYYGADPSNISTAWDWGGNGTVWGCFP
ncbi:MAG: hypothetical protein JXB05_30205 [Myxococcaceae bacterium]|nr:hypothetical protein [Myxococcaceae bacterium]